MYWGYPMNSFWRAEPNGHFFDVAWKSWETFSGPGSEKNPSLVLKMKISLEIEGKWLFRDRFSSGENFFWVHVVTNKTSKIIILLIKYLFIMLAFLSTININKLVIYSH